MKLSLSGILASQLTSQWSQNLGMKECPHMHTERGKPMLKKKKKKGKRGEGPGDSKQTE